MEQEPRLQQLQEELREKLEKYQELLSDLLETMIRYKQTGGGIIWTDSEESGGENPGQRACREGME